LFRHFTQADEVIKVPPSREAVWPPEARFEAFVDMSIFSKLFPTAYALNFPGLPLGPTIMVGDVRLTYFTTQNPTLLVGQLLHCPLHPKESGSSVCGFVYAWFPKASSKVLRVKPTGLTISTNYFYTLEIDDAEQKQALFVRLARQSGQYSVTDLLWTTKCKALYESLEKMLKVP